MSVKTRPVSRRAERLRAFQALYGLSFTQADSLPALRRAYVRIPARGEAEAEEPPTHGFAFELTVGVWKHEKELDGIVARFSRNWRVDRIGKIELTILRMAVFEMFYLPEVPFRASINEAMELARQFSESNAITFISGILDAACKALESGEAVPLKDIKDEN